jgi:hypothetical protein
MDGGGGFTSRRVSSGLGVRDYRAESNGSWWELAGVSYENATFAGPAATAEKVELRGLSMRHFLFASEHDMTLDAETNIGGAWVWDAGRQRQVSTVAGRAGLVARLITNGERRDWFEIGAAVARDAGWLGDGTGLTTSWRIEAPAEISMQGDRIGGAVRVAAESLEIPAGLAAGRDGWRATFTTEWHVALAQGVLVGFHHATTNACVVAGDAYCHVFGGFLRLTGAWPRRHEAAPAEEEPPRQVQDQEQPLVRPQP